MLWFQWLNWNAKPANCFSSFTSIFIPNFSIYLSPQLFVSRFICYIELLPAFSIPVIFERIKLCANSIVLSVRFNNIFFLPFSRGKSPTIYWIEMWERYSSCCFHTMSPSAAWNLYYWTSATVCFRAPRFFVVISTKV